MMDICETQQFDYVQHKFIMNLVENVLEDPKERHELLMADRKLFMADRKLPIRQSIYTNISLQNTAPNGIRMIAKSSAQLPGLTTCDTIQVLRSNYGPAWSTIESDELLYPNQKHFVPPCSLSSSSELPSAKQYDMLPNRNNSIYASKNVPKDIWFTKNLPPTTDNTNANYQPDAANFYAQLLSAVEQLHAKTTSINSTPFHYNSTNFNTIETQNNGHVNDLNENRLFGNQSLGQKFLQTEVPYYKKRPEDPSLTPFCSFCRKNNETYTFYTSHVLKMGGKYACPVLREVLCSNCGNRGHTASHCVRNSSSFFKPSQRAN